MQGINRRRVLARWLQLALAALMAIAVALPPGAPTNEAAASSAGSLAPPVNECANPDPAWIFCDDFEQDRLGDYFEYVNPGNRFVRENGVGVNGSYGMKATYVPGASNAGNLKLAFGRTPHAYIDPVALEDQDVREVYYRFYIKNQDGWTGGGGDWLTRATSLVTPNWAQSMAANVSAGTTSATNKVLMLDPASGTDVSGNLQTTTYNDLSNMRWLGQQHGTTELFDPNNVGQWYAIEVHVKLNDPGQNNGAFQLWINDELELSRTNLNWVGGYDDYGINTIVFENFWGASSPVQQEQYWDNIVVSTERIGAGSVGGGNPGPPVNECADPDPAWIFCDDFEQNRLNDYFEHYQASRFARTNGVGVNGSYGMKATYLPGVSDAGNLKLAFGRTPHAYIDPVALEDEDVREVYWRFYIKHQDGWVGGGGDKLTRATSLVTPNWAQSMIAHVWSGSTSATNKVLMLDPASGTDASGNLRTTTYNDFNNLRWLGQQFGATELFDSSNVGQWYAVEVHVKLNDPGQSNGMFQLWINDELELSRNNLNWVGSYDDYGINTIMFENYWNASSPVQQERYWDNIVVSRERIGAGTSGGGNPPPVDTIAPAAVTDLSAGSATESSITLTWTAPGDDGMSGTAAAYDIRYSTSPITSGNFASALPVTNAPAPASAGTPQSVTVGGLTAGTTYYFAMRTSDEVPNISALSNVASAATTSSGGNGDPICEAVSGGTCYYISNHPGSGSGTFEDPFGMADLPLSTTNWCTLSSTAMSALHPGDVLYFRDGTYNLHTCGTTFGPNNTPQTVDRIPYIRTVRSGQPGAPITIRNYPGENVSLNWASGNQPLIGVQANQPRSHLRFIGFTLNPKPELAAVLVFGNSANPQLTGTHNIEIAYMRVNGTNLNTTDNHDGIRLENARDLRVHHNYIHGVGGLNYNSAGIKLYTTTSVIVEDNYITGNTAGIYDKDTGVNNIYRRNAFVGNTGIAFKGNGQYGPATFEFYDNVVDGEIELGRNGQGHKVHNNLFRNAEDMVTVTSYHNNAPLGTVWNTSIWNNVVEASSSSVRAYLNSYFPISGSSGNLLQYMNYNFYTGTPTYTFSTGNQTLSQIRSNGFEQNSQQLGSLSDMYVNTTSYQVQPGMLTAGRYNDIPGPDNVAEILDVSRYGPNAD